MFRDVKHANKAAAMAMLAGVMFASYSGEGGEIDNALLYAMTEGGFADGFTRAVTVDSMTRSAASDYGRGGGRG